MSIDELAPPDATWTNKSDPRRCWMCDAYSFKVYSGEDSTSGKCFRDFRENRKVWYVDGLMTCPGFRPERNTEDDRRVTHP